MRKNKRGVSPIVSTVLLIMLVIILAIIILLWSRGFIKEKVLKFDKPIENVCSEVSIRTFVNDDLSYGFTNIGNVPIYAIDVKVSAGGKSDIYPIGQSGGGKVDPGLSTILEGGPDIDGGTTEEIKVIPVLLGKTKAGAIKEKSCIDRAEFVVWED